MCVEWGRDVRNVRPGLPAAACESMHRLKDFVAVLFWHLLGRVARLWIGHTLLANLLALARFRQEKKRLEEEINMLKTQKKETKYA